VLGTGVDGPYARQLPGWIVESIVRAFNSRVPAKSGLGRRRLPSTPIAVSGSTVPDRIATDPFGGRTVRANMFQATRIRSCRAHRAGRSGFVATGGAVVRDPAADRRCWANYSMHYFEWKPVSADYFGLFCKKLAERDRAPEPDSAAGCHVVAGTGRRSTVFDFSHRPKSANHRMLMRKALLRVAHNAYKTIQYREDITLAMGRAETAFGPAACPDEKRLAWARQLVAEMKGRKPQNLAPEIYATSRSICTSSRSGSLKPCQAMRVGKLGIVAIPVRGVPALTG